MSTPQQAQRGFTLIELMIVISIVAVLVALAVPAYLDYSVRSKVTECVNMAAAPKLAISEYRQALGTFPPDEDAATTTVSGDTRYCDGFAYPGGAGLGSFVVLIDEGAVGAPPGTIQPLLVGTSEDSGDITWKCYRGNTENSHLKFLPPTCRDE